MGDRIAVMRDGHVVQYAPPAELLARPADDFVAEFVGEDRALRRLALHTVGSLPLDPRETVSQGTNNPLPRVGRDSTVRSAVSMMIEAGTDAAVVVDGAGAEVGVLRLARAHELVG
jgi:osmoprotectant transport system ATP-binding protein